MADIRVLATDLEFPEGPVVMPDGSVILVEIRGQRLTRVWPDGRKEIVAKIPGGPNGAALGPDGKMYICNNGGFSWIPTRNMVLQVNLAEGPYLADVGFGNVAPTAPLALTPDIEQDTPHEVMRFIRMGDELTLQARIGDGWSHIYRVVFLPRLDAEYEICNWSTATHPQSIHRRDLIAACFPRPSNLAAMSVRSASAMTTPW